MDLARAFGFDSHVWMLAQALELFFDYRGHWHDWAGTQHTALLAAQRLGELSWQAGAHRGLGAVYTQNYPDAVTCYERALDLVREFGDRCGEAEILSHLGDSHGARSAPELARSVWQHALRTADEIDHSAAAELRQKLGRHENP
jgi:tetratricopeptide (TPR) repeat protein